jgi:2-dehydro-3-deoxy-D-arabinonate dehydratase
MKFVRIAAERVIFAAEVPDGQLYPLDGKPGAPADYVKLWLEARAAHSSVTQAAQQRLAGTPPLPWSLSELEANLDADGPRLLMPYVPPEAWGAAFTYPARAGAPDPYADVRHAGRPVVFFKATPQRCVGPFEAIGSRGDAEAMIPEPELGVLLSPAGEVIGYTVVNDVSSRDLPQQHPLYMCYSKTFDRCVSLGPAVVAPEAIPDPRMLSVHCRVTRGQDVLWDESGRVGAMTRSIEDLVAYTLAHNQVPPGTLLATGSAMSPPRGMHLIENDLVEISIPEIGRLANRVTIV